MSDLAPSSAHVGACLGDRYDLVRHIARGGMGDVYEAHDGVLDRRVAIKVFRSASPTDRGRFDAEIRLLASLDHPTLVRVYDAGSCGDDAFLVMELVDGPTLAGRLVENGPVAAPEVARLGTDLADALDSIHARGVVHRDVTTSNVLCGPDDRVRLVDFGIARLLGTPRVTATATTVGTAAFMSPEQVSGGEVSGATDVYSLGLVLLEVLTGRRAFDGTFAEVAAARLTRDPDTTTAVAPGWQPLLRSMTSRAPELRPSMATVRDRLRALAQGTPDEVTAAVPVLAAGGGPGSDEATASMALGEAHLGDRTEVYAAPPVVQTPPEESADGSVWTPSWAWAVWAGLAAALVLVVIAWGSTEGGRSPLDATTSTTGFVAATEGDATLLGEPTTSAPTTSAPTTTVTEAPAPTVVDVDGDPFPPGFPFDEEGSGAGKKKKD